MVRLLSMNGTDRDDVAAANIDARRGCDERCDAIDFRFVARNDRARCVLRTIHDDRNGHAFKGAGAENAFVAHADDFAARADSVTTFVACGRLLRSRNLAACWFRAGDARHRRAFAGALDSFVGAAGRAVFVGS